MQEVLRSAILALRDTQAEHHAQLQAHERLLRQVQALVVYNTRSLASQKKATRENRQHNHVQAAVEAAEKAAGIAKLRSELSEAKDLARAEAAGLMARLEGKASKELLKASLEGKANQGELVEMRGRIGRLCSEAGAAEARGRQASQDAAMALEKRVVEVETRVRGCEVLAVRADDPKSVSTRVEGLASELRDLGRRLDRKADASEMEKALQEKMDQRALDATLSSEADRCDRSASPAASATVVLKRDLAVATAAASAATSALSARVDRQDDALSQFARAVGDAADGVRICHKGMRDACRRVERLERGVGAVSAAAADAAQKAARTSRAIERLRRKDIERVDGKARAVADAVRSLAERVEECKPSRQIVAIQRLVDLRVKASEDEHEALVSALSKRMEVLERGGRDGEKNLPRLLRGHSVRTASAKTDMNADASRGATPSSPFDNGYGDGSASEVLADDGKAKGRHRTARGHPRIEASGDHGVRGRNSLSGIAVASSPPTTSRSSLEKSLSRSQLTMPCARPGGGRPRHDTRLAGASHVKQENGASRGARQGDSPSTRRSSCDSSTAPAGNCARCRGVQSRPIFDAGGGGEELRQAWLAPGNACAFGDDLQGVAVVGREGPCVGAIRWSDGRGARDHGIKREGKDERVTTKGRRGDRVSRDECDTKDGLMDEGEDGSADATGSRQIRATGCAASAIKNTGRCSRRRCETGASPKQEDTVTRKASDVVVEETRVVATICEGAPSASALARQIEDLRREKEAFRRVITLGEE